VLLGVGAANATQLVPVGAKVTLEVDHQEYFIGENVIVHFILENVGNQPFEVEFGGDYRFASRSTRFKVTATNQQGKAAEDPDPSPFSGGGLLNRRKLNPGEKFTQSLPLMHYCQIVRPGRYAIQVAHDFGWTDGDRKRPVGETTVTFRMPTPVEAEAVVAEMERSHDDAGFTGLGLPIYLEPLLRRAQEGDRHGIEGMSRIATQDATAALIELAANSNTNVALEAATALNLRLPDPALESATGPRGFGPYAKEARLRLVTNSWDAKFAPAVRSLATKFLARSQTGEITAGAAMVQAVGTPAEAAAVISAMGRALGPMGGPRHDPKDNIQDQPQPLRELISAMDVLHKKGFTLQEGEGATKLTAVPGVEWDRQGITRIESALTGEAELLLYFTWLANAPGPRSDRWLDLVKAYGPSTRFPTRAAILNSIPQPMPDPCTAFVESRLEDTDFGVCRAACAVAGESGRKVFLKPLLDIIATEHHELLLREATQAAKRLGAGFELLDVWADRLSEEGLCGPALDNLQTVIEGLPGNSSGVGVTRSERIDLRNQWKAFLAIHANEIRAGKKFKLDDPALTPALFGRARTFHLPDGKSWPATRPEVY
jgi:hypothetical protein